MRSPLVISRSTTVPSSMRAPFIRAPFANAAVRSAGLSRPENGLNQMPAVTDGSISGLSRRASAGSSQRAA